MEKELKEVKPGHNINTERRIRAEENQRRAESERQEMEKHLATAVADRTSAKDVLTST